jgi:hypothetical protein
MKLFKYIRMLMIAILQNILPDPARNTCTHHTQVLEFISVEKTPTSASGE